MSNKIIIELQSKDQATGQIIASVKQLETSLDGLEASGNRSFSGLSKGSDEVVSSLGRISMAVGAAGIAIAGLAFKEVIKGAEEFEQKTIGIASMLTSMAAEGQGSFKEMFERNLGFAKKFFDELRKFDAERASSLEQMTTVYQSLVTQGYQPMMKEAESVAKLTDLIREKTMGQTFDTQAFQEIRAIFDGTAKATSRLAMELQQKLGPAWADIVQSHKEARDLTQFLVGLYPGLTASSERMQETITAQATTLKSQLLYVGREGLSGAYEYIVEQISRMNVYLKENADTIIPRIQKAWDNIKIAVGTVGDSIVFATGKLALFAEELGKLSNDPLIMALLGAALGSRAGPVGTAVGLGAGGFFAAENIKRQAQQAQDFANFGGYETGIKEQMKALPPGVYPISQTDPVKKAKDKFEGMNADFMERFRAMADAYKAATGKEIEITDTFRTFAQQADLYKRKPGLAVRPGTSLHEKGLAMDINTGQANELARMGLLDLYGFKRPMLGQGASGKNEPWHIEMRDYKAEGKEAEQAQREIERAKEQAAKKWATFQDRERKKELQDAFRAAAEERGITEKLHDDNLKSYLNYINNRKALDDQAKDWNVKAWQSVMSDEKLTMKERLAAGEQFKTLRLAQIDAEIDEIRNKYGARVSEDTLASYKKSQIDQVSKQISGATDSGAIAWEEAWKQASRNIQDAMGDMFYNLITQTKSAGDMLKNILNGIARSISQLAAQSLMDFAKQAMGGESSGGGGGFGGLLGGIGRLFGFGGGGGSSTPYGDIVNAIGGISWAGASGGILPNGFTPIGEYASGGIFSRPTLGIIGERGPEAVVPLNRYNQQTGAGNYQISVTHTPTYNYKPTKADYERDAKEIVSALGKELQIFTKRSARDFVR